MKEITKDTVLAVHKQKSRKKCFADNSGIKKRKDGTIFLVEIESVKKIFEAQTGLKLTQSKDGKDFSCRLSPEKIAIVKNWEPGQGSLIYLRDCLSISIALDRNFIDNTSKTKKRTKMGDREYNAKYKKDQKYIDQIGEEVSRVIQDLPYDLICSVPAMPYKDFDLPSIVTKGVSKKFGKQDVTAGFVFKGHKPSLKDVKFDEKWDVWERAQVSFQNSADFNVKGKTIILIDDKYQSGTTMQYIAMKLQQAGAREVYGLSFVKTMGDKDNQSREHE